MTSKNNPSECVGSLLVHSSDLQELPSSNVDMNNVASNITKELKSDECFGTLLVHQSDMKEVTHESSHVLLDNVKNELKQDECVGTLLVHKSDMKEVSGIDAGLARRVTDHMNHSPEITREEVVDLFNDV